MKKQFFKSFIISIIIFSIVFIFIRYKVSDLESLRAEKNIFYAKDDSTEENGERDSRPLKNDDEILFLVAAIDHFNLSDALMLCKANFKTGEIDLISIPRDSRVYVNEKLDKINHAHSKGGIDLTLQTIGDFLNIEIDHYVRVDFKAVEKIVDAIGGVEIDVKKDMYYEDTTEGKELFIDIKEGQQVLDGDKALQFLRFRSYPDGDVGRVEAQQQFMEEFINQTLRFRNITKITALLEVYYGYVDTNIPSTGIAKGLKMILKFDRDKIETQTIPGEGSYVGNTSYYIVDEEGTKELVKQVLGNYLKSTE